MISNKGLPVVKIGEHDYVADFQNTEYRQVNNPSNTIQMWQMESNEGQYTFWYDNAKAKVVPAPADEKEVNGITKVSVDHYDCSKPFFDKIDVETQEAKAIIAAGQSVYDRPEGIHTWAPISDHPQGLLPIVKIYDTDFFLDLRCAEFRKVDDHFTKIPWNALNETELHFLLWYDAKNKCDFSGTEDAAIRHGNVKCVILPPVDLMIRDGIKRHEDLIKSKSENKQSARHNESPPPHRKKRGRGI